jgi:hypothetical protein
MDACSRPNENELTFLRNGQRTKAYWVLLIKSCYNKLHVATGGKKMTQPQVLEGTWEEILTRNGAQLAGRKVKVYIEAEDEKPAFPPNEKALAVLRQIAEMQEGMRETDGSQTDRFIREGRDGGMYCDDTTE